MTTAIGTIGSQMSSEGHWFHPVEPSPDASIRLFLLPHAGSGAIIYRDWERLLPPDISPQAVTLPGRHNRREEETYENFWPLLEALHEAVLNDLDDRPFAFFGHCLGAQLARVQLRAMFEAVLDLLGEAELAGEPVRLRSNFQNGLKSLPIRW